MALDMIQPFETLVAILTWKPWNRTVRDITHRAEIKPHVMLTALSIVGLATIMM